MARCGPMGEIRNCSTSCSPPRRPPATRPRRRSVWRDAASFAELETDRIGSSIARVAASTRSRWSRSSATSTRSASRSPTSTRRALPTSPRSAAGIAQILVGQRVEIQTRDGAGARRRRAQADPPAEGGPAQEGRRARRPAHRRRRRRPRRGAGDAPDRRPGRDRRASPLALAGEPPRLALDGQPARRLRRARGRAALRRARRLTRRGSPASPRSRRRSACTARGTSAYLLAARRSRSSSTSPTPPTRPGSRRRRSAATRSARAGDRPRLDPLAEGLRAARRDRRARGHRPHDRGLGPLDRDRRRRLPDLARRDPDRAGLDPAALHALAGRDWSTCATSRRAIELLVAFASSLDGRRRPLPLAPPRAGPRTACRCRPARPRRARGPRSPRGRRRA